MINVAIVEDNNTIREGLAQLINGTDGYKCIGAFGDVESFTQNQFTANKCCAYGYWITWYEWN